MKYDGIDTSTPKTVVQLKLVISFCRLSSNSIEGKKMGNYVR